MAPPNMAYTREMAHERIMQHSFHTTLELVVCLCSWYTKRGDGAWENYATHLSEVLFPPTGEP